MGWRIRCADRRFRGFAIEPVPVSTQGFNRLADHFFTPTQRVLMLWSWPFFCAVCLALSAINSQPWRLGMGVIDTPAP